MQQFYSKISVHLTFFLNFIFLLLNRLTHHTKCEFSLVQDIERMKQAPLQRLNSVRNLILCM